MVCHPINTVLGYKAERLFIDEAEIAHHPTQQLGGSVMPGDIMYRDITEDGIITSDDRVRMGHPTVPEIVYGFGPSFNYKSFDFSFCCRVLHGLHSSLPVFTPLVLVRSETFLNLFTKVTGAGIIRMCLQIILE